MNQAHKLISAQARDRMLIAVVCPFVFVSLFGALVAYDRHLKQQAIICQEACVQY